MTESLFEDWVKKVYLPGRLPFQHPNLLVMDYAPAHKESIVTKTVRRSHVSCNKCPQRHIHVYTLGVYVVDWCRFHLYLTWHLWGKVMHPTGPHIHSLC